MLIQVFCFPRVYIFAIALHFVRRFRDEILASHRHCLLTSRLLLWVLAFMRESSWLFFRLFRSLDLENNENLCNNLYRKFRFFVPFLPLTRNFQIKILSLSVESSFRLKTAKFSFHYPWSYFHLIFCFSFLIAGK